VEAEALGVLTTDLQLDWCLVAPTGSHAQGTAGPDSELELQGIWIAPTADLLRVVPPPLQMTRQGNRDGTDVTLYALELGEALRRLLDGDSYLIDAIYSHRNVVSSEVHEHLVERARDGFHRGHVEHYLRRARSLRQRNTPGARRTAAATLLQAAFMVHTGVASSDPQELARQAGQQALLSPDSDPDGPGDAVLDDLEARVRAGFAASPLPTTHPRPEAFDEFLLFVREARW
jgi:hypothetical protein